jgi:DNA-binding XRE family transcriptional regulator
MSSVLLVTDSPSFASQWSAALQTVGFSSQVCSTHELHAAVTRCESVVFDGSSGALSDGALMPAVGLARALGMVAAIAFASDAALRADEALLFELCGGLIARGEADVARVVASLQRRCAPEREARFAHFGPAPTAPDLLAIFDDAVSALLSRPLSSDDDGSDLLEFALAEDRRSVRIELASGAQLTLEAASLLQRGGVREVGERSGLAALNDVDGVRLGQRLRALRLAAGLTQAELARRTGIHRPNIARVEAGRHTPSLETLARLAAAIGISTTRVLAD